LSEGDTPIPVLEMIPKMPAVKGYSRPDEKQFARTADVRLERLRLSTFSRTDL
jgi:hypothetical protein